VTPAKSIDPELNELFTVVNHEVTWLHTVWELFIQLYGTSDENFDVMNASAPQFFAILKTMLFDELVMILNRLTDPATTRGKANACLEQLIKQIDRDANAGLATSLKERLEKIRANYSAFRTWRDKKVSHNDLPTALQNEPNSLPGIPRAQAAAAAKEIVDFMNEYSLAILGGSQSYMPFLVARGDGNALLQYLKQGIEAQEKEA
jgi:hypothetical protein